MSSEILSVLEYMEKETGIPRADMIATITNALKTAALKGVNSGQELRIDINPKNGQLHAWALMKVVDSPAEVVDAIFDFYQSRGFSPTPRERELMFSL